MTGTDRKSAGTLNGISGQMTQTGAVDLNTLLL
jgi:hypothetical protein